MVIHAVTPPRPRNPRSPSGHVASDAELAAQRRRRRGWTSGTAHAAGRDLHARREPFPLLRGVRDVSARYGDPPRMGDPDHDSGSAGLSQASSNPAEPSAADGLSMNKGSLVKQSRGWRQPDSGSAPTRYRRVAQVPDGDNGHTARSLFARQVWAGAQLGHNVRPLVHGTAPSPSDDGSRR